MKKLLIPYVIICSIFVSWQCFAQVKWELFMVNTPAVFTPSCSQSSTFIARTSDLTLTEKQAYNAFICGLVTDGSWTSLDALYLVATHSTTDAVLNLKSSGNFDATIVGSCTFAADSGITGDGSSCYFNSNYNPSTQGGLGGTLTISSVTLGGCVLNNRITQNLFPIADVRDAGNTAFLLVYPLIANPGNDAEALTFNGPLDWTGVTTAQGTWGAFRSGTAMSLWQDAVQNTLTLSTVNDQSLMNASLPFMAFSQGGTISRFSTDKYAAFFVGSVIPTNAMWTSFVNRLQTYMTSIGAPAGC